MTRRERNPRVTGVIRVGVGASFVESKGALTKAQRHAVLRTAVRIASLNADTAERALRLSAHRFSLAREAERLARRHLALRLEDARKENAL